MTGVYKVRCAGDRRRTHLHGNKETRERGLIPRKKKYGTPLICFLDSAGGCVDCIIILAYVKKD